MPIEDITIYAARANRSGHVFWQLEPDGAWFGDLTNDPELAYGGTVEALEVAVGPTRPVRLSFVDPARDASHERELLDVIDERDHATEWADKLAGAVATLFGEDIGEHSNMNEPWRNALELLTNAQAKPGHQLLAGLADEIARQDRFHPSGYPATRDGVFLGIHTAIHELEREAIEAWRADRCKCETPLCGHARWVKTQGELLQAAAVIMRTIRSIVSFTDVPPEETIDATDLPAVLDVHHAALQEIDKIVGNQLTLHDEDTTRLRGVLFAALSQAPARKENPDVD